MSDIFPSSAARPARSAGAVPPPLDTLVERCGSRPVYLACAAAVPSRCTDMVHRWLAEKYRHSRPGSGSGTSFVNSRGLYGSRPAWLARWPQDRGRWGAAIVLTTAEPFDDPGTGSESHTGAGIPGMHRIADGGCQEIVDLAGLGRPVLWLAMFDGRLRQVASFSIEQPEFYSGLIFARLFHAIDAEPFVPAIGRFSLPLPLPLPRLAIAGEGC